MTRVLLLIKGLAMGGSERLLLAAAPHLDRARFEYEIAYLLLERSALVPDLERSGLPVHCLDAGSGPAWVARLRRLVRDRCIRLVHGHSPSVSAVSRLVLPHRIRLVYTEHGSWSSYHPATHYANAVTYWRNDHVFTVSRHVEASVRYPAAFRRLPLPPIETLYHGCDTAAIDRARRSGSLRTELGIPSRSPIVGCVAGFRPEKGHRHLIAAASKVRQAVPDVRFILVGDGVLEPELRRRTRELDLERTVIFAGSRSDAPLLAGEFDVFALPSLHEGMPLALLEAMAHGTASVATASGGQREVIEHEREGLLVAAGDEQALADAIVRLIDDLPMRGRLGEAGRRRARQLDIEKAVRRIESVYSELLA